MYANTVCMQICNIFGTCLVCFSTYTIAQARTELVSPALLIALLRRSVSECMATNMLETLWSWPVTAFSPARATYSDSLACQAQLQVAIVKVVSLLTDSVQYHWRTFSASPHSSSPAHLFLRSVRLGWSAQTNVRPPGGEHWSTEFSHE